MTLLTALVVGVLFGTGAYAMAHRDAFKLAGGALLIGNAAILFLMAPALRGTLPPLLPVDNPGLIADPLVQALALTAVVINFAVTVLLLRVALSVERTHDAIDMDELGRAEAQDEARLDGGDRESDGAGRDGAGREGAGRDEGGQGEVGRDEVGRDGPAGRGPA